jgi:hypothetical protein
MGTLVFKPEDRVSKVHSVQSPIRKLVDRIQTGCQMHANEYSAKIAVENILEE